MSSKLGYRQRNAKCQYKDDGDGTRTEDAGQRAAAIEGMLVDESDADDDDRRSESIEVDEGASFRTTSGKLTSVEGVLASARDNDGEDINRGSS